MQVSSSAQLSSSATLGGAQETIEFGITNDAEFFQILSANLYSNQKLAMVRETICNCWDAHIEAGLQDVAIQISITEDRDLVFRDFGAGIPHELMGKVYGTYGSSTKKTNSATTGGFGLGCKSPFAYTDSFRVTSHNLGTKTVYNITKSSVESQGRPGITKIISMPTTESGLEVRIPINVHDTAEIITYIKSIVKNGEIKATLDVAGYYAHASSKHVLPTLGMSFEPGSYDMSDNWWESYMGNHSIYIRYGNVIYPVLDVPETRAAINTLRRFMDIIGVGRMVVQAAPDTLALTPSRETLSSQQLTVDGIVTVCTDLVSAVEANIRKQLPIDAKALIAKIKAIKPRQLSWDSWGDWLPSLSKLSAHYIQSELGSELRKHWVPQFRKAELSIYRTHFESLPLKASTIGALVKAVTIAKNTKSMDPYDRIWYKYVMKPVRTLTSAGALKDCVMRMQRIWYGPSIKVLKDYNRGDDTIESMFNLLDTKTVFITSRLKDLKNAIARYPDSKSNSYKAWFVFYVSKRQGAKDAPIKAFTDAGWTVVDLTLNHEWDPTVPKAKPEKERVVVEKTKTGNGMVPVMNMMEKDTKHGNWMFYKDRVKNISTWKGECEKPEIYVTLDEVYGNRIGAFSNTNRMDDEVYAKCVVVRNGVEKNMAIRRGAIHIDAYMGEPVLTKRVSKEMETYMTKFRLKGLEENLDIETHHLELFDLLDIKLKGLNKLYKDPELESIIEAVDGLNLYRLKKGGNLSQELINEVEEAKNWKLEKFEGYHQMKSVYRDRVLGQFTPEILVELLKDCPERKAAFRSLALIAIKNRIVK